MGLTAIFVDDWEFVTLDPELRIEKEEADDGTLTYYKRVHYRFERRRRFIQAISFSEDVGTISGALAAYTAAAVLWTYVSGTRKWMLTLDKPTVLDPITGYGEHTQVWEHVTQRTEIDVDTVFGGATP